MFEKMLIIPLILGSFLTVPNQLNSSSKATNNDYFNLTLISNNQYKISSVKDEYLLKEELRVYNDENYKIIEIEENAFDNCTNLSSLMISYSVTTLPNNLFSNESTSLNTINFTGSAEDWLKISNHSNYDNKYEINYFSNDEGFIYMWDNIVRPNENSSICDIGNKKYNNLVKPLYEKLEAEDKSVVDNYVDKAGITINKSMKELADRFSSVQKVNSIEKEVSQDFMATLIVGIALVGMTFITVFYYLKEKQIIK